MGALMGTVIYLLREVMTDICGTEGFINSVITFAVPAAAGAIVYVALAVVLRIDEIKLITDKLRRR
jgi:hypothetical protein